MAGQLIVIPMLFLPCGRGVVSWFLRSFYLRVRVCVRAAQSVGVTLVSYTAFLHAVVHLHVRLLPVVNCRFMNVILKSRYFHV